MFSACSVAQYMKLVSRDPLRAEQFQVMERVHDKYPALVNKCVIAECRYDVVNRTLKERALDYWNALHCVKHNVGCPANWRDVLAQDVMNKELGHTGNVRMSGHAMTVSCCMVGGEHGILGRSVRHPVERELATGSELVTTLLPLSQSWSAPVRSFRLNLAPVLPAPPEKYTLAHTTPTHPALCQEKGCVRRANNNPPPQFWRMTDENISGWPQLRSPSYGSWLGNVYFVDHFGKAQQMRQKNAQNKFTGTNDSTTPEPSTSLTGYSTKGPTHYNHCTLVTIPRRLTASNSPNHLSTLLCTSLSAFITVAHPLYALCQP
uniref:Uncharacterized protein n=1 Tax=Timema cristinae TaxID=61476 RepID=A0A7R9CPV3_TIMCR|nr:unnamed protein product [Timema cristinae]